MKQLTAERYLEEALAALVGFYGIDSVKRALEVLAAGTVDTRSDAGQNSELDTTKLPKPKTIPIPQIIIELSEREPEKGRLLDDFFQRVISGGLLPEAEDIRRFAELAGVKKLKGKSRRDLIPKLTKEMIGLDLPSLEKLLPQADGISSVQRRAGYSILTDTLMHSTKRES